MNTSFLNDINKLCKLIVKNSRASITYRKGQVVFYEDTRPMGVYFILNGKVKTSSVNAFGRENILGISNAYSMLGYNELFQNEMYNSTATVIEEAEIYYISKEKFMEIVEKDVDLINRVMNLMKHDPIAV
ncbi:MAG: Crp/Fnr family transcriptional regulator [Cytophagaceae bacterium]